MQYAVVHRERVNRHGEHVIFGMFEVVTLECGHQKRYRRFLAPLQRAECDRCTLPRRRQHVFGPDDLRIEEA